MQCICSATSADSDVYQCFFLSVIIISIIIIAVIFYVKFHKAVGKQPKHLLFKERRIKIKKNVLKLNVLQPNIFVFCVDLSYKQTAATTVGYLKKNQTFAL